MYVFLPCWGGECWPQTNIDFQVGPRVAIKTDGKWHAGEYPACWAKSNEYGLFLFFMHKLTNKTNKTLSTLNRGLLNNSWQLQEHFQYIIEKYVLKALISWTLCCLWEFKLIYFCLSAPVLIRSSCVWDECQKWRSKTESRLSLRANSKYSPRLKDNYFHSFYWALVNTWQVTVVLVNVDEQLQFTASCNLYTLLCRCLTPGNSQIKYVLWNVEFLNNLQ